MPFQQTFRWEARSYQFLFLPFLVHVKKEIKQRLGPDLLTFFMNEDELSEDMGVAQRMQTGEFEISLPTVMNEPVLEFWQDCKEIQRFLTAFLVNPVPGHGLSG